MTIPSSLTHGLADRYRLERELGAGGMATVYLAHDLRHDRPVAIKVLRPELGEALGAERFHQEIQLAAQLQHPHILTLIDSGEAAGLLYYIMPYVAGESLRERLNRDGRLQAAEAIRLVTQVAAALAFAHRQGVVHRDIKPENILLQEGHALVADFGIALAVRQVGNQRLTATGFSLGTPAYMSPEQISGEGLIDGRSDQYSLACLLHELIAGAPPFTGPSAQAVMVKQVTEAAPTLDAPRGLALAVRRALQKNPTERFPGIDEFAAAVGRVDTPGQMPFAAGPATIVVLPFVNRSPDPDTEYFSDGLTDEIISDLAKIRAIRVISRVSSSQYKGTAKNARTIGTELAVRYVASGTVRRAGQSLRITAELIDTETDTPIWSEKFDGTLADVFEVQEQLARRIVEALRVTVTPEESRRIAVRSIEDLRAYDCYLRARQDIYRFDPAALNSARAAVYEAMSVVGENAHLHANLSLSQWMAGNLGAQLDESSVAMGHAHADRAIALGPDLAVGYMAKGFIATKGRAGSVSAALPWIQRALSIEKDPDALLFAAWYLAEQGDTESAVGFGEEAVLVDPLNFFAHCARTVALVFKGQFDRALAVCGRISECGPTMAVAVGSEGMR